MTGQSSSQTASPALRTGLALLAASLLAVALVLGVVAGTLLLWLPILSWAMLG